jgi:hypothetical protein
MVPLTSIAPAAKPAEQVEEVAFGD